MNTVHMRNLIKIYDVVQVMSFLLTDKGRTYRQTDSHSDYIAHLRVVKLQSPYLNLMSEVEETLLDPNQPLKEF